MPRACEARSARLQRFGMMTLPPQLGINSNGACSVTGLCFGGCWGSHRTVVQEGKPLAWYNDSSLYVTASAVVTIPSSSFMQGLQSTYASNEIKRTSCPSASTQARAPCSRSLRRAECTEPDLLGQRTSHFKHTRLASPKSSYGRDTGWSRSGWWRREYQKS